MTENYLKYTQYTSVEKGLLYYIPNTSKNYSEFSRPIVFNSYFI